MASNIKTQVKNYIRITTDTFGIKKVIFNEDIDLDMYLKILQNNNIASDNKFLICKKCGELMEFTRHNFNEYRYYFCYITINYDYFYCIKCKKVKQITF